jgi:hypothetical protein
VSARVFGAAVRGPDHERDDTPCQDAWAYTAAGERGAVLCLCDGAGSAAHSDIGAQTVVAAVVEAFSALAPVASDTPTGTLTAALSETLTDALRDACIEGRHALIREAAARGLTPADLACTLIAVAAWGGLVAVVHIGDGAVIGRMRATGELVMLSAPERGEFANETWFITSASWSERLRVSIHEGVEAVCALTDGCQGASMVGGILPFAPFCTPLFDFATEVTDVAVACAEVAQLLDAAALRRSSGDDKTLAVALLSP